MMNYIYILECEDGSYYTGWTNDLEKRFHAHCSGKGAKYTKTHHPVRIAYYEEYKEKLDAMSREWHLKQLTHQEKKELIQTAKNGKGKSVAIVRKVKHNKSRRTHTMKVVKCSGCGKINIIVKDSACPTKCCGEPMVELQANTEDAAQEKHVPVIIRDANTVSAHVGSVDHPMEEKHYIEWIALVTDNGYRLVNLKPGDKPETDFYPGEPVKAVYAYCNLHGLWKTEI